MVCSTWCYYENERYLLEYWRIQLEAKVMTDDTVLTFRDLEFELSVIMRFVVVYWMV